MTRSKLFLVALIALLVGGFFYFDLGGYLTLEYVRDAQQQFRDYHAQHPLLTPALYFLVYVLVTGLSLPGAAVMTLLGGALFGLALGTLIVSFASTFGATLAFLVARYLARDLVQEKFAARLGAINRGIEKDGAFYLLTLRLVPLFPFFLVNLLMGLTQIRLWTFYWVSQLGMLAGTLVYVNAGTQLASVENLSDLLSPGLLGAFVLLGLFPWLARGLQSLLQRRRVYRGWKRPKKFDRNLIVIGGGAAGLVTAYIGAAVKASVSLVEKHRMGGDCLNTGCVPSKALLRSASVMQQTRELARFGLQGQPASVDFSAVMQRIQRTIARIEPHDSVARYTALGVECLQGEARLVSPWEVEIRSADGAVSTLSARHIVLASGARPFVPPIPGIEQVPYLTSDTLWSLSSLPQRLLVLGGGPIGCELAQAFARLGARVTLVEMQPRLLLREDEEVSEQVAEGLRRDGVELLLGYKAVHFRADGDAGVLDVEGSGGMKSLAFDKVLVAVGRKANTEGLGLEKLGIAVTASGTVEVNAFLQTRVPNILACGDVAGPYQFTHTASHQAWYAAVNSLFGHLKKFAADYRVIPAATFTSPEVARVGLNERDALAQGISYEVTRYDVSDLDRAIADDEAHGFVKVLTVPGKDRILGVTIVAPHAADMLSEFVLAMRHNLGLNKILSTIHPYPTLAEANKYAAGEWKRAHAPQRLLRWLQRYHAWRLR